MLEPLDISTKYYFWKPYAAYFKAFELKAYRDFTSFPNDGRILDLGCSDGTFAQMLKELLEFKTQLIGVDYDENQVQCAAQKKFLYSQVLQLDASNLTFQDESFDAVFANQVLHCLGSGSDSTTPEKVIKEVSRILKKDGMFMFTVATDLADRHVCVAEFLKNIGLSSLANFYRQKWRQRGLFVSTFSREQWLDLLKENGLSIQNAVPFISADINYRWSLLSIYPLLFMKIFKIIPLKQVHNLVAKIMKQLMISSYNRQATTIPPEDGHYILVIAKKS